MTIEVNGPVKLPIYHSIIGSQQTVKWVFYDAYLITHISETYFYPRMGFEVLKALPRPPLWSSGQSS
jgi:hypothetical protein